MSCSGRLTEPKEGVIETPIYSWLVSVSVGRMVRSTGDYLDLRLASEAAGRWGQFCRTEPFTFGVGCSHQGDSVRIELKCRTRRWCQRLALCGEASYQLSPHTRTLESVTRTFTCLKPFPKFLLPSHRCSLLQP